MKLIKRLGSWLGQHPTSTDGMVALVLSVLAFLSLYINWGSDLQVPAVVAILLTVLVIWPFAFRRRYPLAMLIMMTVALLIYRSLNIPESDFISYAVLLVFFSAGVYGRQRWRDRVRGLTGLAIIGLLIYSVFFVGRNSALPTPARTILYQLSIILLNSFLIGAAWWIGDVFRIRRQRELELQERTVQLEHERDENARRAVLDERVHIARELHDVVAHHVSVMGIQAGAARRILKQQPDKANDVLSQIEASSRQAVAEMQRLLGFLRQQSQTDELEPQPTLRQLGALVDEIRSAGLPVEVIIEGEPQPLPPSVDLSAYRIVQEALTNTLKHAGPARATVTIRYTDNAIELEILDNGQGPPPNVDNETRGRGLIGMHERVSLHGGEFKAGKATGTGFLVHAKLPLTGWVR